MNFNELRSNILSYAGLFKNKTNQILKYFIAADKKKRVKLFRWSVAVILSCIAFIGAVDCNFLWLFGDSPSVKDILHPQPDIASEVYSEDSVLLGKYYYENRVPVHYSQISPMLMKTLVATEDERFYSHFGIDLWGSVSAVADAFRGNPRGASTITQQLVKNLYKTRTRKKQGLLRKVPVVNVAVVKLKEMINAFKLELLFDKKDIITLYLNTVDFGNNAFGIKTASKAYFNTVPLELKADQCALLVGILKATSTYNPITHKKRAKERRNVVLAQMKKHGIITVHEYDSLVKIPVRLKLQFEKVNDGSAFYFRQSLVEYLRPWLNDKNYDLYADGLKIYTTVNSRLQRYADSSVVKNMRRLQRTFDEHWAGQNPWVDSKDKEIPGFVDMIMRQSWEYHKLSGKYEDNQDSINYYVNIKEKRTLFSWKGSRDSVISLRDAIQYNMRFLHAGIIAFDPGTGEVKAWVGGINYEHFKFDHVTQSKRQPGSTFKAFVYAAAIDNGFDPCDSVADRPIVIKYNENGVKKTWSPHNADWTFSEKNVTLKYAFARSLNCVTVRLGEKIGWKKIAEYAVKMGIESPLDTLPAMCLGVSEVSLQELVRSYCTIANGGERVEPLLVKKVTDRFGHTLVEFKPQKKKVLSDETAFLLQQLFLGTMTEPYGTTQALFQYDLFRHNTDIGGKTGTSSNHSDGWFVAITPKLVAGAWVGGEERCIHFKTSALGEGCRTALPLVGMFLESALNDESQSHLRARFEKPTKPIDREYKCATKYVPRDSSTTDSVQTMSDEIPVD